MRYCQYCKDNVNTTKKFNWAVFILSVFCFGIGGVIYLLYYWGKKPKCIKCGAEI